MTLVEYASAFRVCPYRVVVSTDWSAPGQGVVSHHSRSQRQSRGPWPGLATFLGLELKHSRGLDVVSSLTRTLSLWSADPRLCS